MVPAGEPTEHAVAIARRRAAPGDVVIDGGNTYYRDDLSSRGRARRSVGSPTSTAARRAGCSGSIEGFCLMVGCDDDAVSATPRADLPVARAGVAAAPRTPGAPPRSPRRNRATSGYGPVGAGHFVKMVHNGIEYALMQAYAEGMNVLHHANVGAARPDARRRNRAARRSVVLSVRHRYRGRRGALAPGERGVLVATGPRGGGVARLADARGLRRTRRADSGEGRWTAIAAIEEGVPAEVLIAALSARFSSRGQAEMANRLLSAMRWRFGGHVEPPT